MIDKQDNRFKSILKDNLPSDEQVRICDFIAHGIGNASIESRAGSGKSKTIELGTLFVPEDKSVLVLSYNVHIAENLRERFKGRKQHIDVMTYHSLGLKILQAKYKNIVVNDNKYRDYIHQHLHEFNNEFDNFSNADKARYMRNIEKLLDYSRFNLMQSIKEINKMVIKYGVNIFSNECEAVRKIMKWGSTNINEIDYTDMIWLPYELGIVGGIKWLSYDVIFVDEAQDSSPAQQNLINICMKRNTRFLIFGDSFQTINAWCGSDEDAFKTFNKKPNIKQFKLNITYRCAKKIAERAREIVNDFVPSESAIEGEINYNVGFDNIKNGDMILCRLTSPLVKLYIQLINQNKQVYVKGYDFANNLISLLNNFQTNDIDEIRLGLEKNLIKCWENCAEIYHTDLKSVVGESDVMIAYDELLTFNSLAENIKDKTALINRINELFIEHKVDENNAIQLTTVHRAKGLESDNVYILCPSLMPNKMATKQWEINAEQNILYVAITRAKKSLNFISEKLFPPEKSYSGVEDLYNEFLKIKEHCHES